jgi:hypothetical protein
MSEAPDAVGGFGVFARLTRSLRHAETTAALYFSIVNETRRLTPYRRAMLLRVAAPGERPQIVAASGVPAPDRQAPLIQWLERTARGVVAGPQGREPHVMETGPQDQAEFAVAQPLWLPLSDREGELIGVLWLEREQPWRQAEVLLLIELADAQAHALWALTGGRRPNRRRRHIGMIVGAAIVGGLFLTPMQRVALAPAEIVAGDAEAVAAPIDGVIRSFQVRPNQKVAAGDLLFTLDDTDRRARADVAAKALDVARVEYRQASQGALGGRRDAPKLAALEAQISLREIDRRPRRSRRRRFAARRAGAYRATGHDRRAGDVGGRPGGGRSAGLVGGS